MSRVTRASIDAMLIAGVLSLSGGLAMAQFMQFPTIRIDGSGSDGTNTWAKLTLAFKEPIVLKSKSSDVFTVTISDDLSGFKFIRVSGDGAAETI